MLSYSPIIEMGIIFHIYMQKKKYIYTYIYSGNNAGKGTYKEKQKQTKIFNVIIS